MKKLHFPSDCPGHNIELRDFWEKAQTSIKNMWKKRCKNCPHRNKCLTAKIAQNPEKYTEVK